MFGKKLNYVLTDCDGTISHHDFSIDDDTRKSILKYQKKSGYRFSFITGRLDISNKKIINDLKIQLPIVSCNGALITDPTTGEILAAEYIDKDVCVDIFRSAFELGLDIMVYEPNAMVGTPDSARLKQWMEYKYSIHKKYRFNTIMYNDLSLLADAIEEGTIKPVELVFSFNDEKTQKLGIKLFNKYIKKIDHIQSMSEMMNVMSKGVNKLTGLIKWAELIGIDYKQVVTFGDNYNDIEMVQGVNRGFAVENAVNDLKDVAYKVIDSIDYNGVGRQLEEIIDDVNGQ